MGCGVNDRSRIRDDDREGHLDVVDAGHAVLEQRQAAEGAHVVVRDADADGVGAVVGEGVAAVERTVGEIYQRDSRTADVVDRRGGRVGRVERRIVVPIDPVAERLDAAAGRRERIRRVVEAVVGDHTQIHQRDGLRFEDRLAAAGQIAVRQAEHRDDVVDLDREREIDVVGARAGVVGEQGGVGKRGHVVVGQADGDRVGSVVGIDVVHAVEQLIEIRERGRRRSVDLIADAADDRETVGRRAIAPVDLVAEETLRERIALRGRRRIERVVEARIGEPDAESAERDDLAFVDDEAARAGEGRRDVGDDDGERLDVESAIIVVNRDGDRVGAVVGEDVAAAERAGRVDAGAAVGVGNRLSAHCVAAVAPIDVVGERLGLLRAGIVRVVEAWIAEERVEADGLPFVDRRRRRRDGERRLDVARPRLGTSWFRSRRRRRGS